MERGSSEDGYGSEGDDLHDDMDIDDDDDDDNNDDDDDDKSSLGQQQKNELFHLFLAVLSHMLLWV